MSLGVDSTVKILVEVEPVVRPKKSHQQRRHGRRRFVTRALCICSAAFVSLQLLLAHSGLARRGIADSVVTNARGSSVGDESGNAVDIRQQRFLLLIRAQSSREKFLQRAASRSGIDAAGELLRRRRVVECLRALDGELRQLAVQPIPTVEAFSSRFLAAEKARTMTLKSPADDVTSRLPTCLRATNTTWDEARDVDDSLSGLFNLTESSESDSYKPFATPELGGSHAPLDCRPKDCVLLLIPYRSRRRHLKILLRRLHPVMQTQKLCYTVVVAEQNGNATFNKAKLMNAAFLESVKLGQFACVIFHDVDLIPANEKIPYSCPAYPRHNSVSIDKFGYSLPYKQLVGGVLAMPKRHFLRVNGYSNLFWGWGGEDDDMETRIRSAGLLVTRPNPRLARYHMIRHGARKEILGEVRYKLLHLSSKRYRLDGLNSLNYSTVSLTFKPLYTHILIDIGQPPPSSKYY